MDWVTRMNAAVDCMETRLTEADAVERAARAAQCSVYNFQRSLSARTQVDAGGAGTAVGQRAHTGCGSALGL